MKVIPGSEQVSRSRHEDFTVVVNNIFDLRI
jgi:hypothetical protein